MSPPSSMWRCRSTLRSGSISCEPRGRTHWRVGPTCLSLFYISNQRIVCVSMLLLFFTRKKRVGDASIFHRITHTQTICQFPCDIGDAEENVQVNINGLREPRRRRRRETHRPKMFLRSIKSSSSFLRSRSVVDGQLASWCRLDFNRSTSLFFFLSLCLFELNLKLWIGIWWNLTSYKIYN